jgi:hypothetical protein
VPLTTICLYWRLPTMRPKLAVLLGASTPFLLAYSLICAAYPFRDTTNPWAAAPFEVAQRMSLLPYFFTLVVAIALAIFSRVPVLLGNYFLGLFVAPIGGFIALALVGVLLRAV